MRHASQALTLLPTAVHSDLNTAREQSQSHQLESQNAATQAAAALALNMKLQSNTTKNQTKAIDLEIQRLDAAQARELLSIVQVHLSLNEYTPVRNRD